MKRFAASPAVAISGLVLATMGMITLAAAPPEPVAGLRKAPEFVFNLQDGKQLLLSSLRGKTVAIAFMFTTCPHCQALCPVLANIQKDYTAKGVQFVGDVIDPGAKDGLADFTKNYSRGAFPVGWSTQESALEFMKHPDPHFYVPMMAFVDKRGYVRDAFIGDNDFFREQDKNIRGELDKIISGATVTSLKSGVKTAVKK